MRMLSFSYGSFSFSYRLYTSGSTGADSSKSRTIEEFWKSFYIQLSGIAKPFTSSSNVGHYHDEVIRLLLDSKVKRQGLGFTKTELIDLQTHIEDLTMMFDETSLYKITPSLIKLLIINNMPTAKEYLKSFLSTEDLSLLHHFGHYTLEALIIHVLGLVFNCVRDFSVVRVSTLVEQLDSAVRVQAKILAGKKASSSVNEAVKFDSKGAIKQGKRKVTSSHYAIGAHLVNFLVDRKWIYLSSEVSFTEIPVSKKKGKKKLPGGSGCSHL